MPQFQALMTAIYPTPDLSRAKAWYTEVFGVKPYFDEPFYVGFEVEGFELGLMPSEPPLHQPGNQGVVAYWGVDDIVASHRRVLSLGAKELGAVQDVGGDIKVSMVADPDGNAIGLIQNPHFKR